jgi:hypothetical protein
MREHAMKTKPFTTNLIILKRKQNVCETKVHHLKICENAPMK